MAPNQKAVELQTDKVIQYLLQDDVPGAYFRCQTCSLSDVEADGPTGSEGRSGFVLKGVLRRPLPAASGVSDSGWFRFWESFPVTLMHAKYKGSQRMHLMSVSLSLVV